MPNDDFSADAKPVSDLAAAEAAMDSANSADLADPSEVTKETELAAAEQSHSFEFRGRTGEYFRIWIVNILLMVLTLGIFSAWAKVRNNRYFYGNTYLNGANFEYTASAMKILIARIIVLVILLGGAIWAGEDLFRNASHSLLLVLLLPWALARGFSFNARYSLHRNVPFGFKRDNKAYLTIYLVFLPFVLWVVIGYIHALHLDTVVLTDTEWGAKLGTLIGYDRKTLQIVELAVLFLLIMLLLPWMMRGYHRFKVQNHRWGTMRAAFAPRGIFSYLVCCWWIPLLVLLIPTAVSYLVYTLAYAPLYDALGGEGNPVEAIDNVFFQNLVFIVIASVCIFPVSLVAYMYAKLFRLYWESLVLAHGGRMRCEFTTIGFALKITTVNFFIRILSLGLLAPWAKIRRARYLASNMVLIMPAGAMDKVLADNSAREGAMGEEFEASEGLGFDFGLM